MREERNNNVDTETLVMAYIMRYQRIPMEEICKRIGMKEARLRCVFHFHDRRDAWEIFRLMSHDEIMNTDTSNRAHQPPSDV